MASHGAPDARPALPDVVPFDLPHLSSLSWELGSRVVADDESTRHSRWDYVSGRWRIAVFDVTSETAVIRTRTPVGRERFYGATRADLEAALPDLERSSSWRRIE